MSVTVEPTVTPAPKPEWPELTRIIVTNAQDSWHHVTDVDKEKVTKYGWVYLATVTIPSSADCERRAKVEAALEKREQAINRFMVSYHGEDTEPENLFALTLAIFKAQQNLLAAKAKQEAP